MSMFWDSGANLSSWRFNSISIKVPANRYPLASQMAVIEFAGALRARIPDGLYCTPEFFREMKLGRDWIEGPDPRICDFKHRTYFLSLIFCTEVEAWISKFKAIIENQKH